MKNERNLKEQAKTFSKLCSGGRIFHKIYQRPFESKVIDNDPLTSN